MMRPRRPTPGPVLLMAMATVLVVACGAAIPSPSATVSTSATLPATPSGTPLATPAPTSTRSPSAEATSSATPDAKAQHMVVIGDSIPFAAFCPGCNGWVAQYAAYLEKRHGRTVEVANRSRNDSAELGDIVEQIKHDATLRDQVAAANIVIVSVGHNNAVPDASQNAAMHAKFGLPWGCGGDMGSTIESYVDWALRTTDDCRNETREAYATLYDTIYGEIRTLRGDKPTLLIATDVYDANLHAPDIESAGLPKTTATTFWSWLVGIYDRWDEMECEHATAVGFTCVDLYHAFNGPDGDQPLGPLTIDGTHPSQAGNDLIANLLAQVGDEALTEGS